MARSDLTHRCVSTHLELVAPSLCELVCGLVSCPRMASSAKYVLLFLLGLLFGCAFMGRERTQVCPCAGAGGSLWEKLRHYRSVSATRLNSQAYAWRLARVWCKDLCCRQGSLIKTVGLCRFSQAVQQVQAVAQVRKARLGHPSLQNLGPVGSSCCFAAEC